MRQTTSLAHYINRSCSCWGGGVNRPRTMDRGGLSLRVKCYAKKKKHLREILLSLSVDKWIKCDDDNEK